MSVVRRLIPGTIASQYGAGDRRGAARRWPRLGGSALSDRSKTDWSEPRGLRRSAGGARIAAIAKEAEAANSKEQLSLALRRSHSNSIEETLVPAAGFAAPDKAACASAFVAAVEANLRDNWGLEPLRRAWPAR